MSSLLFTLLVPAFRRFYYLDHVAVGGSASVRGLLTD